MCVNPAERMCPFPTLCRKIGGPEPDTSSGFKGGFTSVTYRLGGTENVTVEVNNVLVNKEVHNVFGVIKGFIDPGRLDHFSLLSLFCSETYVLFIAPRNVSVFVVSGCGSADRYVVLGAQRDAWGQGYAKATVGTSVLIELAKAVREMVEKGNNCNTERISSRTRRSVGGVTTQRLCYV